ncbi:MAG: hypothetical protein HY906_27280 [Deltaproteobacteria bacterium]|nr:hypothetical protein [Deltaproteobacteria bacterium]
MEAKRTPGRRRRRTSGFVPRIKGNALFTRCLEEMEKQLSPRRSGLALAKAISLVGATPETVTLGHLVRAVDLTLAPALAEHCEPDEAREMTQSLQKVLDELASTFFPG